MTKFFKVHVNESYDSIVLCTKTLDHILPLVEGCDEWKKGHRSQIGFQESPNRVTKVNVCETVDEVFDILARKAIEA